MNTLIGVILVVLLVVGTAHYTLELYNKYKQQKIKNFALQMLGTLMQEAKKVDKPTKPQRGKMVVKKRKPNFN